MTAEETMFNEVLAALDQNEPARARDLLTRLIKADANNPQYWLYMSAVVETPRERLYCLKEAQKLAPDDPAVQRGLAIFGEGPVNPGLVIPLASQKRNWQAQLERELAARRATRPLTRRQIAMITASVLGLAAVVALVVFLVSALKPPPVTTARQTIVMPTAGPTSTTLPTPSPVVQVTVAGAATPLPAELRPEVAYTPTPLYVQTPHTISENFTAGMRAYAAGDFDSAASFFKSAATDVPDAPDILYYMAEAQRQRGNAQDAQVNYELALKIQADFPPALLGMVRLQLQQPDPAIEPLIGELETAVATDPAYLDAWLELANLQLLAGDAEAAQQALDSAVALEAGASSPLVHLYRARTALLLGDPQAALEDALTANKLDVSLLAAYRTLGEVYHQLGRDDESIPPLAIYAKFAKSDPAAPALLGVAYARSGQPEEALKWLNQALQQENPQAEAYAWRGWLLLEMDEAAKAYQDFDQAIIRQGDLFLASLGRARALLALKYPDEAFDQFNKAEKLADTPARQGEFLYYYAQALEKVGSVGPALNKWKDLLTLPAGQMDASWLKLAKERVAALSSPTPSPTFTRTPTPTLTSTPSRTPTARTTP